jgi:fibronectin type 3 domain-containing protein
MKKLLAVLLLIASTRVVAQTRPAPPRPGSKIEGAAHTKQELLAPTQHYADLSWSDADPGLTAFNVYRSSVSSNGYALLGAVPPTQFTYRDLAVTGGATYYYVATAANANGESGYSNEVKVVIPASPNSPVLSGTGH